MSVSFLCELWPKRELWPLQGNFDIDVKFDIDMKEWTDSYSGIVIENSKLWGISPHLYLVDVAVELPLGVGEGGVGVLQVDHLLPRVGELLLHLPLAPGEYIMVICTNLKSPVGFHTTK